jgi:hypothetical protein
MLLILDHAHCLQNKSHNSIHDLFEYNFLKFFLFDVIFAVIHFTFIFNFFDIKIVRLLKKFLILIGNVS